MMKSRVLSSDLLRVCAALAMVFVVVVHVDGMSRTSCTLLISDGVTITIFLCVQINWLQ